MELHRSSIREVALQQAGRAAGLVEREEREAAASYAEQRSCRLGKPRLIVETDGSMVRTGKLEPDPAGGMSSGRRPKHARRTRRREARLSVVEGPGGKERRYAAALGSAQRTGEQMFALALGCGYGGNTWVHGVGDGALWTAQQMAAVFPRQRFLLDRHHLLEHLHEGAPALTPGDALAAKTWVEEQAGRIDAGNTAVVVAECLVLAGGNPEHPLYRLYRLAGYLEDRQGQMDYATAGAEGLPIGSGMVEGGHRAVIQARLKLPGAWWKEETVNPMLALRTLRANGQREAFWH